MLTFLPAPALLVLLSFFFVLAIVQWSLDKLCGVGLVGQIGVGVLYGMPIGNILLSAWQEAFAALGNLGLVLMIFEGRLPSPPATRPTNC